MRFGLTDEQLLKDSIYDGLTIDEMVDCMESTIEALDKLNQVKERKDK